VQPKSGNKCVKMAHFDLPDVDIDTADRTKVLEHISYVNASINREGKMVKHNTGIYVTDIGFDPRTKMAAIDYKEAETLGYIKLDILNVHVYELVRDEEHLNELMAREPNWKRIWTDKDFCGKIIHIGNYFDLLIKMKPDSVARMAMFISVIRPGKKHLQDKPWKEISQTVWDKTDDGYAFKHSHAISYAELVKVHMNLLDETISA